MFPEDSPKRKAWFLVIPSLLLVAAGFVILPWLLETRRRLDNDYWEGQLLFASLALCVALCGVPFVCLRLFRRVPVVAPAGWCIVALGYLCLTVYVCQSHFTLIPKFTFVPLGFVCFYWALEGFVLDRASSDTPGA